MSKSSSRGKNQQNQQQLTQHFSLQDKTANVSKNMSPPSPPRASSSNQPLTLDMLVKELGKLRKEITGELTLTMNAALAPIQSSLQNITETVTTHSATIITMETALTSHSDELTALGSEVADLKSMLKDTREANEKLQLAVEDLISRSKRQNLRVVGIDEGAEGDDARLYMTTLFKNLIRGDRGQLEDLELDRAHRSLGPKPAQGSRPIIVRFHRYTQKERVLQWAKRNREVSYQGFSIRIYEDFSPSIAKKRASFIKIKYLLFKEGSGVRFGLLYPARLRITRASLAYLTRRRTLNASINSTSER